MVKKWNGYRSYREFLESPEWATCRWRVIARDGGECRRCGCQERLEGHHLHYRRLLDPDSVICLCHWCHEHLHEVETYEKRKKSEIRRGHLTCVSCSGRYYCQRHGG